ncbi:MAG: two-CW domain-containing protein [Candidatus Electrothrix sp. YB6]
MEENTINCWEFKKCGREPGGKAVALYGVCPAAVEQRADGIHNGKNGGRCCWIIGDSYCSDENGGYSTGNFMVCRKCEFYRLVKDSTDLLVAA